MSNDKERERGRTTERDREMKRPYAFNDECEKGI